MKTCLTCAQAKPFPAFAKAGTKDGVQLYKAHCKDCVNTEMRRLRPRGVRLHTESAHYKAHCPHGPGVRKFIGWGYHPMAEYFARNER